MIDIFGSQNKVNEILFLLKDLKPVVRQGFYPHELEKVKDFCQKNNLFCELSPYKILLDSKNYSDHGQKVPRDHPEGLFFVYISKDQEKALLANLYETRQDHYRLGLILGYPECCVQFYCAEFENNNIAPEHNTYNELIDIRKRKTDEALISHFPCKPDCPESLKLAQKYLEISLF